jgi:hypothetical protein
MSTQFRLAIFAALVVITLPSPARAATKTVCTITVNSPDEKDVFERNLPPDDYRFVELVERGRPDWLASACRQGVSCDALIISGHFDGGDEFYTDRLDRSEFLPVRELERVSCSDTCPSLFGKLKEVYLFGCNTLNGEAMRSATAEIARSLVRSGQSPADAEKLSRLLSERYGESNRDRMRQIFKDVPVLYGFSSKAPLGRSAGPLLERYFQSAPPGEIASGRVSARLLGLFAPSSMIVASGLTDADPRAGFRQDVCRLADDRPSDAQKVAFVHEYLQRDVTEVRMFLDHLQRYSDSLEAPRRQAPETAAALSALARDGPARERYLEFARDADQPAVQSRMLALAQDYGWLSPADERAEFLRMVADRMTRNAVGASEVDWVCTRNRDHDLDYAYLQPPLSNLYPDKAANAAVLACLGSREARARVLRALLSAADDDAVIAQVYLRHRPEIDPDEVRALAAGIGRMPSSGSQVRALDTLARFRLADAASLSEVVSLFPQARSIDVQRAIAGVLIRSDYQMLARADLARSLRAHRKKSPDGEDLIDVLIRRLQAE